MDCPFMVVNVIYLKTADTDGTPLISEERICLALSAVADTELNLARIGSMYSKADTDIITVSVLLQLGVSAHDHSTPLRVLLNTVSHAPGAARSFGAVLIGYLGLFCMLICVAYVQNAEQCHLQRVVNAGVKKSMTEQIKTNCTSFKTIRVRDELALGP
uniref:Uncharacterized protein n=1 Tax=Parascaris equorum TaxID=6256 RepID=A0A914RX10_PAREQ